VVVCSVFVFFFGVYIHVLGGDWIGFGVLVKGGL